MKLKENLFLLFFFVVVFGLGYLWYTQWREAPVLEEETAVSEEGIGREFLSMIVRMKKIRLDTEFLASEEFRYLKDMTPVIELPKVVGRKNPFLPIGGSSAAAAATTTP